jgi:hypothetical protein
MSTSQNPASPLTRRAALRAAGGLAAGAAALIGIGSARPARAQPADALSPRAGTWKPWLLSTGDQFRPGPPPDAGATTAELAELRALAGRRDRAARDRIAYWGLGAAPHRWNDIYIRYANVTNFLTNQLQSRALTLLNVAIYDAMIATWDAKYTYRRARPASVDPALSAAVPVPQSPSYPSEHAAAAGAASALLGHLYPRDARMFMDLAEEAGRSRVEAGVQYPSDVAAGLEIGRRVGALAAARSDQDDLNAVWDGQAPAGPGLWTGMNPPGVVERNWKPFVLPSADAIRPPPPPAPDSPERAAEIAEVKNFARTPRSNGLASVAQNGLYGQPATHFVPIWRAHERVQEYHLEHNAPWVARLYAAIGVGWLDGYIASQDAKFFYWTARPNQFDHSITTVIPTPNFPSYVSNVAVLSGVVAPLLAHAFPRDAAEFAREAEQAAETRLWAGIHFRSDLEAGKSMGKAIAALILDRMKDDAE